MSGMFGGNMVSGVGYASTGAGDAGSACAAPKIAAGLAGTVPALNVLCGGTAGCIGRVDESIIEPSTLSCGGMTSGAAPSLIDPEPPVPPAPPAPPASVEGRVIKPSREPARAQPARQAE